MTAKVPVLVLVEPSMWTVRLCYLSTQHRWHFTGMGKDEPLNTWAIICPY